MGGRIERGRDQGEGRRVLGWGNGEGGRAVSD
jgi:hypothetical protein